jgi:Zn-dependent protease
MSFLLGAAGVLVLLKAVQFTLVLTNLLRGRSGEPSVRVVGVTEEIAPWRERYARTLSLLAQLGFGEAAWVRWGEGGVGQAEPVAAVLLRASGTAALVRPGTAPQPGAPHQIEYYTWTTDGRSLCTTDRGHLQVGKPPEGRLIHEPSGASARELAAAHEREVARLGLPVRLPAAEELAGLLHEDRQAFFAAELASGARVALDERGPEGETIWRLRVLVAVRLALETLWRLREVTKRISARQAALKAQPDPQLPAPEEEAEAFERMEASQGRPLPRAFGAALFAVSGALFVCLQAALSSSLVTGLWVVAVLALHEGGHYLAMRRSGFRDANVFFVPGLGAMTTGSKRGTTLSQELAMLLAGPGPGIVLGGLAVALGAGRIQALSTPLSLLLVINLINLLPLGMLDGGKVAHALLFARTPWLDVASRLLAALAFAGAALALQQDVVFWVLAAAAVASVLPGLRTARLRARFGKAGERLPPAERPAAFFRTLHDLGMGRLPFAQKVVLARSVLHLSGQNRSPGFLATAGWLSLHGALFIGGCVATFALFAQRPGPAHKPPVSTLAPLQCPRQWTPSPPAEHPERPQFVQWVVRYPDERRAAQAEQELDLQLSAVRLQQLLLVGRAPEPADASEEDEDEGAEESPQARERLAESRRRYELEQARREASLRDFGGAVLEHGFDLSLACTVRSEAAAAALADEAGDAFALGAWGRGAPWHGPVPEEVRRAQRTHRAISDELEALRRKGSAAWLGLTLLTSRDPERLRRKLEERDRELHARVEERVREGGLDPEVARLVVAAQATPLPAATGDGWKAWQKEREEAAARLAQLTGQDKGWRAAVLVGQQIERHQGGAKVRVRIERRPDEAEAMLGWLCSRGCEAPLLVAREAPKQRRPDAAAAK